MNNWHYLGLIEALQLKLYLMLYIEYTMCFMGADCSRYGIVAKRNLRVKQKKFVYKNSLSAR